MRINYVDGKVDNSKIAELYDNNNSLLLRVHAHKLTVYANREDDLADPNVPFTLTTEYKGALCWSNAVDLQQLKTLYYEMMANLASNKVPEWRMFFASSQSEEVYTEFLTLIQTYAQYHPGISIFEKEQAAQFLINCPRFVDRFIQKTKWNRCFIAVKNEFINVYQSNWIMEGKQLK